VAPGDATSTLTERTLAPIVTEAIRRWAGTGVSSLFGK